MEHLQEALDLANDQGMDYIISFPEWNGKEMCEMIANASEDNDIGYPNYCAFENNKWRPLETGIGSECMDYMEFLEDEYGFDDDGNLIGFEEKKYSVK